MQMDRETIIRCGRFCEAALAAELRAVDAGDFVRAASFAELAEHQSSYAFAVATR